MSLNLPDSLIVGPMRTGTTWVYEYLKARGDVCLPAGVKETFFFDRRFDKGVRWYAEHFAHFEPGKHVRLMEVAPSYFHSEEAPRHIQETLGSPRLIAIIRDPVERSISHYRHLRRRGLATGSLRQAIQLYPEIIDASRYARHLERWEGVFGPRTVHLLWQDRLRSDPEAFIAELCRALELPVKPVPAELLRSDVNTADEPFSFWLARTGLTVADWLREHRLYAPIELTKRLGLKSVFFGSERAPSRKVAVLPEERAFVADVLAADWQAFQSRALYYRVP